MRGFYTFELQVITGEFTLAPACLGWCARHRLPIDYRRGGLLRFAQDIGLENEWPVINSVTKIDHKSGYRSEYDSELEAAMFISWVRRSLQTNPVHCRERQSPGSEPWSIRVNRSLWIS